MSSLSAKDRVSLCKFTFSDGRRCRTPRTGKNPYFCFDHAAKEARARASESLCKDLAYFFSGGYLSACDLSTALGRLIPAVIRGDVKPKIARTVAYMAQTLLQTIHISEDEYINTFGTDGWRKSIRNSVNGNHNYRFPPGPKREQQMDQAPHVVAGLQTGGAQAPQPAPAAQPVSQPAPPPYTSLPPTSAEFFQRVVAGRNLSRPGRETGSLSATPHVQPAPPNPKPAETPQAPAAPPNSRPPTRPSTPPRATPSLHSAPITQTGATSPAPPQPQAQPPASQPVSPPEARPSTSREPNRDAPWLHFGNSRHIHPDSKLL